MLTGLVRFGVAMRELTRKRLEDIVRTVEAWPGANLRQVQRASGVPLSTTVRYLDRLVDEGRLRMETTGGYKYYYVAGKGLHKRERVLLATISRPRPRRLLEVVLAHPGIRHKELSEAVGLPPPTTTYYMKQMVVKDLVVRRRSGTERHYRIKNPDMLEKALTRTAKGYDAKIAKG
jgi:DNA-binding IclR family transcriptional regulator